MNSTLAASAAVKGRHEAEGDWNTAFFETINHHPNRIFDIVCDDLLYVAAHGNGSDNGEPLHHFDSVGGSAL